MAKIFFTGFYRYVMLTICPIKNLSKIKSDVAVNKNNQISFCGLEQDSFNKELKLRVYNPYTLAYSYNDENMVVDLSKPQTFCLNRSTRKHYDGQVFELDYNPNRYGYLVDKQKCKPVRTMILSSVSGDNKFGYHFLSEDLKEEYGYVNFSKCLRPKSFNSPYDELLRDYPMLGIKGERLIVDYLENLQDSKIGGVGHLADKLSVKYCADNKLPLNIVSMADLNSHVAHYLRGKRFFPLDKEYNVWQYNFFMDKYGISNVNKILRILVEKAKLTGEKIDISDWGTLPMYMPKRLALNCLVELKRYPIL